MAIIRVDWFKRSGKWYAGQELDVGDTKLYDDAFKQVIVDKQTQLYDGWQGEFHVVTRDLDKHHELSEYKEFYMQLFDAAQFVGILRSWKYSIKKS
jgi:hypothetical protein